MGSTGIAFADKSQLAISESPASYRVAFALYLVETGLRMCPGENSRDNDPVIGRAVRSPRSGLLRNNHEIQACFAYFGGKDGGPPYNVRMDGHASGKGKVRHRNFQMASGEMDEFQFISFLTTSLRLIARQSAS